MTIRMEAAERAAWLRLAQSPGIGPVAAHRVLREFGLPTALFAIGAQAQPAGTEAAGGRRARLAALCGAAAAEALCQPPTPELRDAARRTEDWVAAAPNRFLVTLADADYPRGLLELRDAPILLHGEGQRGLLQAPAVAIVGSRNATRQGMLNAAGFSAHLGCAGLCIVSGLASGIDSAAHRGALDAGCATLALLGTGVDVVYPTANRLLARQIAAQGLLLSEYPIGMPALAGNFPRRNRLIAALARGVLVIEAALHSGSLITARLAADLGRAVCAVPGSIHSPLSRGCHRLIVDGARLTEQAQDVLDEIDWCGRAGPQRQAGDGAAASPQAPGVPPSDPRLASLLAQLGHDPVDIDTLTLRSGEESGKVAARLLELELCGAVERLPGNRYQRVTWAPPPNGA